MKIYIVFAVSWLRRTPLGVFDSIEKAREYIDANKDDEFFNDSQIEEWELNKGI